MPPALGYSIHSFRRAGDRRFAIAALGMSGVEAVMFLVMLGSFLIYVVTSLFK